MCGDRLFHDALRLVEISPGMRERERDSFARSRIVGLAILGDRFLELAEELQRFRAVKMRGGVARRMRCWMSFCAVLTGFCASM
jgi:hypothetical protein